jgi:hypothetical protein
LYRREKSSFDIDVIQAIPRNTLDVLVGLVTRLGAKRFKEAFNGFLQDTWVKMHFKKILNNKEQVLINLIHIQEGLISGHSNIIKKNGIRRFKYVS